MIAFTDPDVHPASGDFYRTFPFEPVGPGAEARVDQVREIRHLTMERLLDEVLGSAGSNGEVLIVYHGTEAGLSMPLTRHNRNVHANSQVMAALDGTRPDSEVAQILLFDHPQGSGAQRARDLRDKIRRVKDLRLNRVELRACNTGLSRSGMMTAKAFFGAARLGAPDARDAYFRVDPGRPNSSGSFWESWLASHPTHRVFEVPANGRFALAVRVTAHARFQPFALADQATAAGFWIDAYVSRLRPTTYPGRGPFPAHGLWTSSDPSFPLVFPGEPDYARHIVRA